MPRALVLVHTTAPGAGVRNAGTVLSALREQGFEVAIGSLVDDGAAVPGPDELDLLVVMGSADPAVLPPGTWIEWHDDAFTLPPGATEIARNDVCVQAFTHGAHLGVQFHPEITPDVLAQWVESWGGRGRAAVEAEFDLAGLVTDLDARAEASAAACRDLVARFCARLPHTRGAVGTAPDRMSD